MPKSKLEALALSRLYATVEKDRRAESERHKEEVKVRGLTGKKGAKAKGQPLNLYADGDSWFEYPLSRDTIGWIKADGNPTPVINNQAHHGDTAVERLGLAKRQRLIANLDASHGSYDGVLFSAGGNDIVGDQFVLWIVKYVTGTNPANGINRQRLANILGVIKAAFDDLIGICYAYNPKCPVFLHGYDFALPSGVGACPGVGPWLKPSLDFQSWVDPTLAAEVVKEALMEYDKLLALIELQHPNVRYVRTQGTLDPGSDWANELHPTRPGFKKIAQRFIAALRNEFPGRI